MLFDWTQVTGGLVVLLALTFFYFQFRHSPRATEGVKSGAELQARIGQNPYTLV